MCHMKSCNVLFSWYLYVASERKENGMGFYCNVLRLDALEDQWIILFYSGRHSARI